MPVQSLAIVVPVHNEEESLPSLFAALHALRQSLTPLRLRVVLVDDHSDDRSASMIRQACSENDWLGFVRLSRRSGSHVAIIAGFDQCGEDCAAFISADLQDPPALLHRMIELCDQQYDVVWAARDSNDTYNSFDAAGSVLFHVLTPRALPFRATFALLSRRAYRRLVRDCRERPSLHVEISRLDYPITVVTYRRPSRQKGRSKWTFFRKVCAFFNGLVSWADVACAPASGPLYQIEDTAGLSSRLGGDGR